MDIFVQADALDKTQPIVNQEREPKEEDIETKKQQRRLRDSNGNCVQPSTVERRSCDPS